MPKASLLLRETLTSNTLTSIVEKSQHQKPPYLVYEIIFNSTKLDLVLQSSPSPKILHQQQQQQQQHHHHQDEGFESDIDSLSLISSDESFTSSVCLVEDHVLKNHQETDSANGSESDTEHATTSSGDASSNSALLKESFPLNDVLCYTDVSYPKVLVFVVIDVVYVYSFDVLENLRSFYASFNTLKAITNQRTYGNNITIGARFNLLQRTDSNGVTHIEVSREKSAAAVAAATSLILNPNEDSSIISLNTPEDKSTLKSIDDSKIYLQNEQKSSRSEFYPNVTTINSYTLKHKKGEETTLRKIFSPKNKEELKKTWKSAESLLKEEQVEQPKRPERRRKQKGRAPPPPIEQKEANVMKGQYIRVAVDPKHQKPQKIEEKQNFHTFSPNIQTFTPNWNNIRTPQSPLVVEKQPQKIYEYKKNEEQPTRRNPNWTNSVPRLLRKQRSKSETRQNQTPMAYRYIDTTNNFNSSSSTTTTTISNRLFGLSQKLKEFGTNVVTNSGGQNIRSFTSYYEVPTEQRRNSLGEMTYKKNSSEAHLKSVIKKDDKKKCEKKVTFSAYATVQVV